ncbi:hypothetical protein ILUMI_09552 [Ignelater luminosus]|uniref:Major facilitator superfamily (MFS) profile domain-containing protein n=1 Tax=Ignelater luminosus TaxID=2038154 RepID=A0A8K0GEF0_IGNLU|nr:hypothetical protein ILUMI_09552 [Ignelater luminosus]
MTVLLCANKRIELPFLLIIFAVNFGESITTNWLIFRTCYATLGYNISECTLLGTKYSGINSIAKLEELVEPHASVILMAKQLIGGFGTPIVCFFLGPWSDKYGRKPVILLTTAGMVLQYLIFAIVCEIHSLSPWFILLTIIPLFFSGGLMAHLAGVFCYINDITSPKDRGIRIALVYAVTTLGSLLASLSSSHVLRLLSYFEMFLTVSCCLILGWLMILLSIEESVTNPETGDKYSNIFKLSLVQETVKYTFKRRDNYGRLMILIMSLILVIYVLADNANSITFLYVRQTFHWSLETYAMYSSINTITTALGSVAGIYFLHKLLKINESFLIMIGFISVLSSSILNGLANKSWHIYLACAINCLYGTVSPMTRSFISKLVSVDEYGRVFSFLAVCESCISPLGSPLFTFVYNKTLSTSPGTYSLVAAGVSFLGLMFSILIISIQELLRLKSP